MGLLCHETYRTRGVEPHHADNLVAIIAGVKGRLALACDAVQGYGDGKDGHSSQAVHNGQFRPGLVTGEMDQLGAIMGLSDWIQRRLLTQDPFPICWTALEMTHIHPHSLGGDKGDVS